MAMIMTATTKRKKNINISDVILFMKMMMVSLTMKTVMMA